MQTLADPEAGKRPVALVTGGARRIGAAIATRLSAAGYAVIIHCNHSLAEGEALAQSLRAAGGQAAVLTADLADAAAVIALGKAAAAPFGPVTLLVNNASVYEPDDITALDLTLWEQHFAVNLRAPSLLASAMAAALPEGASGAIINIIDQRIWRLTPDYFSYTLSKSALWAATQTLAQRLAPRIRVNAVGPGPTLENRHEGKAGLMVEAASTPLETVVPPEAIADAVLYLAEASHVTGQMIAVDSGQHLA